MHKGNVVRDGIFMKADPTDELMHDYHVELYRTKDSRFRAVFTASGEHMAIISPPCNMSNKDDRRRALKSFFSAFQFVFRGWSFPEDAIIAKAITGGDMISVYADDGSQVEASYNPNPVG